MSKQLDYIIVGQGIAGTTLAFKLIEKGHSVKVLDNEHKSSSSLIAGGVTHPMSFKRIILSWKADQLIPYAIKYYNVLEKKYNQQIFYPQKMARIIASIEEQNNWQGKTADPPLNNILYDFNENLSQHPVNAPYGLGGVNLAGRLDIKTYLNLVKEDIKEHFLSKQFNHSELEVKEDRVIYKDLIASNIIFCEGYKYIENPYFNYLPNNLTKGEILIIKSDNIPPILLSKGCFLLPIGNNHFILGATYQWNNFNSNTTEDSKEELLEKLKQLGDFKFEIIEQRAGVRPTIPDRRPILGRHPKMSNVILFNGLGSKGVMIAPFYADHLIEHLETNKEIDKEVSIDRFSKKHLHKFSL